MDNINELNDQIYACANLVSDNIGIYLSNPNRNTKPKWEMRLEEQIRKLQQQTKLFRKEKHTKTQKTDDTTRRNKSTNIVERMETQKDSGNSSISRSKRF